jgi:hypothetical protein
MHLTTSQASPIAPRIFGLNMPPLVRTPTLCAACSRCGRLVKDGWCVCKTSQSSKSSCIHSVPVVAAAATHRAMAICRYSKFARMVSESPAHFGAHEVTRLQLRKALRALREHPGSGVAATQVSDSERREGSGFRELARTALVVPCGKTLDYRHRRATDTGRPGALAVLENDIRQYWRVIQKISAKPQGL